MLRLWYWLNRRSPTTFKPVILVTGCGSGIGAAIAELLYSEGNYRVVVTARKESVRVLREKFPENERFLVRELDVTNESQRTALILEIESKWRGINILVNNAGISYRAVVEHMTEADEQLQMAANYFGPMGLIRGALPKMREIGRGKIINISSVSGMLAMPTMASYSASKHALEGASEALWYEMRPLGINVTLIQPGFIRSNSFQRVYHTERSRPGNGEVAYRDYYDNMGPFIERLMNRSLTSPSSVARLVLRVIQTENPPLRIPATIDASIFYYLHRWIPRRWFHRLLFSLLPGARRWGIGYTNRRRKP